jgi:hypothetical protein
MSILSVLVAHEVSLGSLEPETRFATLLIRTKQSVLSAAWIILAAWCFIIAILQIKNSAFKMLLREKYPKTRSSLKLPNAIFFVPTVIQSSIGMKGIRTVYSETEKVTHTLVTLLLGGLR